MTNSMRTRRGGMWGVSKADKETVDRKVKEIVKLHHLGDIPLTNRSRNEDLDLNDDLRSILRDVDRSLLHAIVVKIKTYPHSQIFVDAIRKMGGRKTKRGGWPWSTSASKEDVFADEIIADPLAKATAIIRSPNTNLERLRKKIVEKDKEKRLGYILHYIDDEMTRYKSLQPSWDGSRFSN